MNQDNSNDKKGPGGSSIPGQQPNPFGGNAQGKNVRNNLFGQEQKSDQEGGDSGEQNPTQGPVATPPAIEMPEMPKIELPKGGGAIQGIGEKFETNPATGTGSFSIPIAMSPGRAGFGPGLGLSYNSGSGNSPFGMGWDIGVPSISRKTGRQLPVYTEDDARHPVGGLGEENDPFEEGFGDVFLMSGAEDLVRSLKKDGTDWIADTYTTGDYEVQRYRPRTEGLFARIEKWTRTTDGDVHWRSITKDNIHTVYGQDSAARVVHPDDSTKVFQWMIERSWDDSGNIVVYEYKQEDNTGVSHTVLHEAHRLRDNNAFNRLYLKRVLYGNTEMYSPAEHDDFFDGTIANEWLFQLVMDYGEHDETNPLPTDTGDWSVRQDPFSSFRSGFELRTYRLCKRILMFHEFAELNSGSVTLVKSTNLAFDENPVATRLNSVQHWSYQVGEDPAPMPAVEMTYSTAEVDNVLRNFDTEDLENVPAGVDGNTYTWNDLDSEGIAGILTDADGAWFYKRNLGDERYYENTDFTGTSEPEIKLGPLERVASKPAGSQPQMLSDIDGDGRQEVVMRTPQMQGYFEQDAEGEWLPFTAFRESPNIDFNDPFLRMIDLNGSGQADILLTTDHVFRWYPAKGKKGYGEPYSTPRFFDDAKGPSHVHSITRPSAQKETTPNDTEIYLADMTGDGLTDIVRIANGSVSFWPNVGYGYFGARVDMSFAPSFDHPDLFDHGRLRLADVDGSGTTDLIYFGTDTVRWWKNQSGNSFSLEATIDHFPRIDNLSGMQVIDLFGKGTSCLVWSSPLPGEIPFRVRYIELQPEKPYLLKEVDNNMGSLSRMHYAPSTKFYLKDRREGRPWITKLPFPVQVVERSEVFDQVTQARFVSLYAYHHGYYDTHEREFRGFGMVEQWDTEHYDGFAQTGLFEPGSNTLDEASHIPPIYTKSWFHNGWYEDANRITSHYKSEYFQGDDDDAWTLPETQMPPGLSASQQREAVRALRGKSLRVEVYGEDNTAESDKPFSVSYSNYHLQVIQPLTSTDGSLRNRHGVFLCTASESLSYYYERNTDDPRIAHSLVLDRDDYGHPTKTSAIGYPRRPQTGVTFDPEQTALHVTYSESLLAHDISSNTRYRLGVPYQTKQYEIHGLSAGTLTGGGLPPFRPDPLLTTIEGLTGTNEIDFEVTPVGQKRRLIGMERVYFYENDLSAAASLGTLGDRALMHHTETLALTEGLVDDAYNSDVTTPRVDTNLLTTEGGYIHDSQGYWIPSPVTEYLSDGFYLPSRFTDPFDNHTDIEYDPYELLPIKTTDALQNVTKINVVDYRVMAPQQIENLNGNLTEVAFDVRGMVVESVIRGKAGSNDGDVLGDPTMTMDYKLFEWQDYDRPNYVHTSAREVHGDANSPWQESYEYSGGLGQTILVKVQAEDGDAYLRDPNTDALLLDIDGKPQTGNVTNRWVGNGRTILNNKGLPVKAYEPYFSSTHAYEDEAEIREYGVTPIMHYDSMGRNISTELPDGTYVKTEFDVWEQRDYDQNDTVIGTPWHDARNNYDPNTTNLPTGATPDQRAGWLASFHYDTPRVNHVDSLGRTYLSQDDYGSYDGTETTHKHVDTKAVLDIQGNKLRVIDARNFNTDFTPSLLGGALYTTSPDGGWRRGLVNVIGNPMRSWDQRGFEMRSTYDGLNRPKAVYMTAPSASEKCISFTVYGDDADITNPENDNARGQVIRTFDQSGVMQSNSFDFKGNPLTSDRRFAKIFDDNNILIAGDIVDWTDLVAHAAVVDIDNEAAGKLELETHSGNTTYDALNRPTLMHLPDETNVRPTYNKANFLESLDAQLRGSSTWTPFVTSISYDAKGQRERIDYANSTWTIYTYDDTTFRLTQLETIRDIGNGEERLQDLNYTFDPVGNITELRDNAQQSVFFNNGHVEPHATYEYDALYRLTRCEGREHAGTNTQGAGGYEQFPIRDIPHDSNTAALQRYTQQFSYDKLGNITELIHTAAAGGFTRNYAYSSSNNQLQSTTQGSATINYTHDVHGNMLSMPHLNDLIWDFADQLREVNIDDTKRAYYIYSGGERVRKVVVDGNNREDRIYLGSNERVRKYLSNNLQTERETLHISDDTGRICMVDTLTEDNTATPVTTPVMTLRWQYSNHLGSASLEVDSAGSIISYEEYHPFGTSSYRSGRSAAETSLKRYRYVGKECDDESGLYYYGARYYAAWLCRFVSVDPLKDQFPQLNPYNYAGNKPVNGLDLDGLQSTEDETPIAVEDDSSWLDDIMEFKIKNYVDMEDDTESGYAIGLLAGLGDGLIETGQMAGGLVEAGMYLIPPWVPGAFGTVFTYYSDEGYEYRDEFYGTVEAFQQILSSEEGRTALYDSLKAEFGEYLDQVTFGGTTTEAGYQHGKLLFEILVAVFTAGGGSAATLAKQLTKALKEGGDAVATVVKSVARQAKNYDISIDRSKLTMGIDPSSIKITKKVPGTLRLKAIGGKSLDGNATAIGRMDTLRKYDNFSNVDTWHKSGRIPGPNDKAVTWPENKKWLQDRIDRGDSFIMTMDPKKLPTKYVAGEPNGWFTKLEYDYLVKRGANILYDF